MSADDDLRRRARRGLAIYFAVLVTLSLVFQGLIIARGGAIADHVLLVFGLMWSPTIAMVVARIALREGVRDVSFRGGLRERGWREWLIAWLYPVAIGGLAYGAAWASGLVAFEAPDVLHAFGPAGALIVSVAINLTLGTLFSALTATGEELGWRGYMLTRLIDAGVPRPVLVSGVIWALWHVPLILSGQYASGPYPILSACLFTVSIIASSYVYARVRLASGSVWPAVLLHASWNSVIQGSFDAFVPGHDASHAGSVWVGESGVLVVLVEVLAALALTYGTFRVLRHRGDPRATSGSLRTL